MADTAYLKGADALLAALKALPDEIQRVKTRDALLAGARIVAARIRATAPAKVAVPGRGNVYIKNQVRARMATAREVGKLAGLTRKGLSNFSRSIEGRAVQIALAGVSGAAYWARWIEHGWNLTTHGKRGDRRVIRRIPAKPFIQPAFEATRQQATDAIARKLAEGVQEAARRLAGPYAQSGFAKRGRTFIG